jgi:excisionase family DNA binding protein
VPIDRTDLIGAAEVAELLGVSRSTVSRRIRDGHLTPVLRMRGDSGAYLFDPDNLYNADIDEMAS